MWLERKVKKKWMGETRKEKFKLYKQETKGVRKKEDALEENSNLT